MSERRTLKWRKVSAWCIESLCGRYKVSKFIVPDGDGVRAIYQAFKGEEFLDMALNAEVCKDACANESKRGASSE